MMRAADDTLHGFTCCACRAEQPHGGERVFIKVSWMYGWDRMCRSCWVEIMTAAAERLVYQTESAEAPTGGPN